MVDRSEGDLVSVGGNGKELFKPGEIHVVRWHDHELEGCRGWFGLPDKGICSQSQQSHAYHTCSKPPQIQSRELRLAEICGRDAGQSDAHIVCRLLLEKKKKLASPALVK